MTDACDVASYRHLACSAGWHLREDTYRSGTAILANAQNGQPLASLFGAADVSSSDGPTWPESLHVLWRISQSPRSSDDIRVRSA